MSRPDRRYVVRYYDHENVDLVLISKPQPRLAVALPDGIVNLHYGTSSLSWAITLLQERLRVLEDLSSSLGCEED